MRHIEGTSRSELALLVSDRIDPDSEVFFIDQFIDYLFFKYPEKYKRSDAGRGRKSFDHRVFFKLYLYCYLNGIRGSRSIEKETRRNLELIWLLNDLHPNYWSINDFRSKNRKKIEEMTIDFRLFLKKNEYIDSNLTAYDGTKIQADASKNKAYSLVNLEKKIASLQENIAEYLAGNEEIDLNDHLLQQYKKENQELFEEVTRLKNLKEKFEDHHETITESFKKKTKKKGKKRRFSVSSARRSFH